MRRFLIQTIEGQIKHDFAFHLLQAINYHNWIRNEEVYGYILSENVEDAPDCIPIGSLVFVFDYLERYHNVRREHIKPINVPLSLRSEEFSGREIYIAMKDDIHPADSLFVKSNTQYKTFTDVIKNTDSLPDDEYMVSALIDIESEWRGFIHQGELVGIQHYIGDFTIFPDIEAIKSMIKTYVDAPISYTLDIAMVNRKCVVVEVHPFVSCGLYGFQDYRRLPMMMIQGFLHMKKEAISISNEI